MLNSSENPQPYRGQYSHGAAPPPGYYPQPPKKKAKWPWVLGGFVLAFVLMIGGCMALVDGTASVMVAESERVIPVTYEVAGSGSDVSITYSGPDTSFAQETAVHRTIQQCQLFRRRQPVRSVRGRGRCIPARLRECGTVGQ